MLSVAQRIARLPEGDRERFIESLSEEEAELFFGDWENWARPEQLAPPGRWKIWLVLAGRGWGKTLAAAQDMARYGLSHPGSRLAVVAPTYADARDTCVEGESGILSIIPTREVATWNRSLGELVLKNGTRFKMFSADEPERFRGPQYHRAWCDELGAWPREESFDMLMLGLRLGDDPRCIITTTPRPTPLLKSLVERIGRDVVKSGGSTYDNADHLAGTFLETINRRYGSTRLGRQEIFAEILSDNPSALWKRADLEAGRVTQPPEFLRIVVGVDPEAASDEGAAETGIIVAALGTDGHGYTLADRSIRATPAGWAKEVVAAFHTFGADRIVAEKNQGGEMVEHTIRSVEGGEYVPITLVHAAKGKLIRAEPVAALYEQQRWHHIGQFPLLEDQMVQWSPGEPSPDRLDALVWAAHELFPLSEPVDPFLGMPVFGGWKGWTP